MSAKISEFIEELIKGNDLSEGDASRAFQIIMTAGATPAQVAAFLVALKIKGEAIPEIVGAAKVLRAKRKTFTAPADAIDTCGTGGDGKSTLNISTAVSLVVAGCKVPVVKHGNRAVSSRSGSADVLESLGIKLDAPRELMEQAVLRHQICFLMAPNYHGAMRHVAPVRRELGIRTIFNILGPLINPALVRNQLLGVYSNDLIMPMAEVLKALDVSSAWVVHGSDGMDEITTTGITKAVCLKDGEITEMVIDPESLGIDLATEEDLAGGSVMHNTQELKKLLSNAPNLNKHYRDIVCLNSAACLVIYGKAENLEQGLELARESLENGSANRALHNLVDLSNSVIEVEE